MAPIAPGSAARGAHFNPTARVDDELDVFFINGENRRAVAKVVEALHLRRRGWLDQQAVPQHALVGALARGEVYEVLGLEHRLAVGKSRAVAHIEDHGSARE